MQEAGHRDRQKGGPRGARHDAGEGREQQRSWKVEDRYDGGRER